VTFRGNEAQRGPGGAALTVAVGHPLELQLQALSITLADEGFEICCAATGCGPLCCSVRDHLPDLALVQTALDPVVPLGFVAPLRAAAPAIRIVVLIDELSPTLAHAALEEEVDGVVLGSATMDGLVAVLRRVAAGESVYPAGWLRAAHRAESECVAALLSDRQRDVLELVAAGLDNAGIAECLHISPNTVKFHLRLIYQRLGVSNRVQAARVFEHEPTAAGDRVPASSPPERVGFVGLMSRSTTTRTPVSVARLPT
jgi:two-component system nitrate/nitrite response regulator NarL